MSKMLTLRLLCPDGVSREVLCHSVRLPLADDAQGRGGGSIGVLPGHTPAVMALGAGTVTAALEGKPVFSAKISAGLASVGDNVVTVFTETAKFDDDRGLQAGLRDDRME